MDDIRIRGQQPQRRRDLSRLQPVRAKTPQYLKTGFAAGTRTVHRRSSLQRYYRPPYKIRRGIGQLAVIHSQKAGFDSYLTTLKKGSYRNNIRGMRLGMKRTSFALVALLVLVIQVFSVFSPNIAKTYALGASESLLPAASPTLAKKITHNQQEAVFNFNKDYVPEVDGSMVNGGPKISAVIYDDPLKGVTVTDPYNQVEFGLKPKYKLLAPKQQDNRIVYPLADGTGWLVYTLQAAQVKEDVLLDVANGDKIVLDYELVLNNGMEARLLDNGGVGIFGSDLPVNGNVTTGSDQDAKLLEKARQTATKNKLLFTLPAPITKEYNKPESTVKAWFELKEGNQLTLIATGLKKAHYPLTIDPSVYVETAAKFMRGNNDSNIDFDTSNELIQKGVLTGARIPGWTSTMSLPSGRWSHGTIVAGGYIYIIGGSDGATDQSTVYWAKIDPNNYTIVPANPGSGACSTWCTDVGYNLPGGRSQAANVTYNGYLYVVGGAGTGTGCNGGICNTIFYSKIGGNGEPNAWSTNPISLPNNVERRNPSTMAYNNSVYLSGGQTNASQNGVNNMDVAPINPNGSLGTWTSTTTLPNSGGGANGDKRWGHSMLQYNGYMYIVGGSQNGALENNVWYIKINTDGTLASTWVQTSSFSNPSGTGRLSFGGNFAQIWGGYIYISGGCGAVSGQNCTTFLNDLQLASLNADGSVTDWTTITGVTLPASNTGLGFMAWRNTLYAVGGCTAMSSGSCTAATTAISYGHINSDGDVSPKQAESSLPAIGNGAAQAGHTAQGVVVDGGYIYNIGGCANTACTTMSDNSASAPINADGTLGAWTVDSTGTLNGTTGLGAFGHTVYNGTVYVVGGSNGSANGWSRSVNHASLGAGTVGTWTEQTDILPDVDTSGNVNGYGYQYVFARAATATTGNLYIISGCWGSAAGIGCSTYQNDVYKCTITNSTGAVSGCTTTSQLQIQDLDAANGGTQGLGLASGAVWGDYIYLTGGACGGGTSSGDETNSCDGTSSSGASNTGQINKIYVAKLDSSGNIVRASVGGSTSNVWQMATHSIPTNPRNRHVAFTVNGYLYIAAGHNGTGGGAGTTQSDVLFAKIDPASGDVGLFTSAMQSGSTNNIITPRWGLGYAAANGYLYTVGGCTTGYPPDNCSAMADASVESLQVYNNYSGSPKLYSTTNTTAIDNIGGSALVLSGYMYYVGGCSNIGCTTATNTCKYSLIGADGTLGTWSNCANTLPQVRSWGKLLTAGGTLYWLGGQDSGGNGQSTIYYTTGISSGSPTWSGTAATASMPGGTARTQFAATAYNNRFYIAGGATSNIASPNTDVYYSGDISAGGNFTASWTSTTAFTTSRVGAALVAYGASLYLLGGYDGTDYLMDVQYAPIASDGSVGTWGYGTSLTQPVRDGSGFAANGYMYVIGGRSAASTCTTNTYTAPILGYPAGSSTRYGIGKWSQTNVSFAGARYGQSALYNDGKAYVLGGGCSAFVSATDRSYYSTLQSQPQVARYSLAIDADIDVFPSNWLMNGIDNGTGARWLFSHRSATSGASSACGAMTAWGQLTNFGQVTLGTPGVYIPKDGSGNNTSCARYFYLIAINDASQSFGFPEDVSRGPTIADISFQFFSSPGRRLIHGKSFNSGFQQPLDTPCRQSNYSTCPLP